MNRQTLINLLKEGYSGKAENKKARGVKYNDTNINLLKYYNDMIKNPPSKSQYFKNLDKIKSNPLFNKFKPQVYNTENVLNSIKKINLFEKSSSKKIINLFSKSYKINGTLNSITSLTNDTKSFLFKSKFDPVKSLMKLKQDLLNKWGDELLYIQFNDYKVRDRPFMNHTLLTSALTQSKLEDLYRKFLKMIEEDYNDNTYEDISFIEFLSGNILIRRDLKGGCSRKETEEYLWKGNKGIRLKANWNNCGLEIIRYINPNIPNNLFIRKLFNIRPKLMINTLDLYKIAFYYKVNIDIILNNELVEKEEELNFENDNKVIVLLEREHYTILLETNVRTTTNKIINKNIVIQELENKKIKQEEVIIEGDYKQVGKYKHCLKCNKKYIKKHNACQEADNNYHTKKSIKKYGRIYLDLETRDDLINKIFISGKVFYPQVAVQLSYNLNNITTNYFGLDCIDKFLDFIVLEQRKDKKQGFKIYAHNGASFDFFLIKEKILNNEKYKHLYNTKQTIIKGSRLIKMCFGIHDFYDTRSFVTGSLEDLCENFKVPEDKCKIKDCIINNITYTSMDICRLQQNLAPQEYIDFLNEEVNIEFKTGAIRYCNYDVISLEYIFESFIESIKALTLKTKINVYDFPTLPAFSMALFKLKNTDYYIPENEVRTFLDKCIIGGISHVGRKGDFNIEIDNNMKIVIDIVSLYPSVMINEQFPLGEPKQCSKYEPFVLGVYRVTDIRFNPKTIKDFKDIPNKTIIGLDWNTTHIDEAWITSIDIKRLRKNGAKMTINEGYYWDKTYNPFQFIKVFTDEKKRQDTLKGSPDYNEAIRTCCKLCPNSLFGKMMERSKNYNYDFVEKLKDIKQEDYNNIIGFSNNTYIVKRENTNSTKSPLQYGVFILAYARDKIMNYSDIIGRENIYTLETDSICCDKKFITPLIEGVDKYKIGKELGQMDVEIENANRIITIAKKCYAIEYKKGDKIFYKMRFKGVPSNKLSFKIYEILNTKGIYIFKDITLFIRKLYSCDKTQILIGKYNKTIINNL